MIDHRYQKALDLSFGFDDKRLLQDLEQIKLEPVSWKAHNSEIFEAKMVMHNEPLLITLSYNENLKIWSTKGVLYGHLEFPRVERIFWRMNDINRDRRTRRFEKTREVFTRLFRRMDQLNISVGSTSKIQFKGNEERSAMLRSMKTLGI